MSDDDTPDRAEPDRAGPIPLHGPSPDDELGARLRDVLRRDAEQHRPADRLDAIVARIDEAEHRSAERGADRATPSRRRWPALVAAACVLVVLGGGVTVGVRLLGQPSSVPMSAEAASGAADSSVAPSATQPSATQPSATGLRPSTAGATAAPRAAVRVPVYEVGMVTRVSGSGSTHAEPALFREYRTAPAAADPLERVRAALGQLGLTPSDPDYRTAWAGVGTPKVIQDGATLVVTLVLPDRLPDGITARAAVQQLVWTAVGAYGEDRPVRLEPSGPTPAWAQDVVGVPLRKDVSARAAIWIDSPEQGAETAAGSVVVTGESTSFEGALRWKVVDASGREVGSGTTSGGSNGSYAPFRFTVDLTAGRYTVSVYVVDELTGTTVTDIDTKQFSVR